MKAVRGLLRRVRRRYWQVRLRLRSVDPTFSVGGRSTISPDLVAGAYTYVGPGCLIDPGVSLGAYTMLGPGVKVVGNDHVFGVPGSPIIFSGRPPFKRTIIGKDVWVGANAVVISGTRIGDGAVVAAGSVVTRDVPPMSVVAGVPARVVRRRFRDEAEEAKHAEYLDRTPVEGTYCAPIGKKEFSDGSP